MDYPLLAIATGQIVAAVLTSWGQKVGFVAHLTQIPFHQRLK